MKKKLLNNLYSVNRGIWANAGIKQWNTVCNYCARLDNWLEKKNGSIEGNDVVYWKICNFFNKYIH